MFRRNTMKWVENNVSFGLSYTLYPDDHGDHNFKEITMVAHIAKNVRKE